MTSDLSRKLLRHRRTVLEACRSWSAEAAGLFWLAVATGGGKTLASLSFAVRHAQAHGLRVVLCHSLHEHYRANRRRLPSRLAGNRSHSILEHHVNLDPEKETPWSRLATENWDAPLVVTTNVQFFESLHAAKPSACRKLHRLARTSSSSMRCRRSRSPSWLLVSPRSTNWLGTTAVPLSSALRRHRRSTAGIGSPSDWRGPEISPEPTALLAKVQRAQASRLGTLDDDRLASLLHAGPNPTAS